MKVLYVPVLERPRVISISTLEDMQDLVGGFIGCTYPWEDKIGHVHNDNGIAEGCVPNRYVWESKNIIFGDFFLAGLSDDDLS